MVFTYEYLRTDLVNYTKDDPSNIIKIFDSRKQPVKLPNLGWYANISYRFNAFFEIGYTWSEFYPDKRDRNGFRYKNTGVAENVDHLAWAKTSTISTRFDLNENWILKFEYSYTDGNAGFNNADNDELKRYWSLFALKVTFSF